MKSIKIITAAVTLSFLFTLPAQAQKFLTKNGHIMFYSATPIETIQAVNQQVNSALDTQTGDFVFKVLMKSFVFEKALMQEHFNENFVESDKFPNSTFQGKITNISNIDFSKPGEYEAMVEGNLTIHGITQPVSEKGKFTVESGDKVRGQSKFVVKPSDFKIKIPSTVMKNIAETIEVTVDVELTKI